MRKAFFIVIVALIVVSIGEAQEENVEHTDSLSVDISEALTLNQCIKIALGRSSSIRMADLDLKVARLDVADARANYLPEVTTTGQYRFSDLLDFGWERQNYDAQINASYNIWDHGRREAELAQAKANERAVQSDHNRTKQSLIFSMTEAYYNLLEAEKLIDVNEKLLEISKGNVDKVTAFEEAGRSVPADVAAARVQQANDELALINAQNNLELARARLASLMGLDPVTLVEIQDDPDYIVYVDTALIASVVWQEDSVAKAIQNRPELERLKARLSSLIWSLKLARLNRWPVITAEYNFNVLLDDYLRDRDVFKKYRNWSAMARISFPIFDAGVSKRREQSAAIAVKRMVEDTMERERYIALEVQQAYLSLERAQKSLDIAREQVIDATESLNVTQGRYEQNMVIFLEILSVQARYSQALINQIKAFYDYKIAGKALQKAMGILQVED